MSNTAQYGSDFYFDTDIAFTDADVRTQDGPHLVAQDIKRSAAIPLGSLPWNTEAGSTIPLSLNAPDTSPQSIQAELIRIARNDPRIKADTITATSNPSSAQITLTFTPLSEINPSVLTFDTLTQEISSSS